MPQAATNLRVGSMVRINLDSVRERIPANLVELLKKDPRGTLVDYKMTDGQGIGVVLQFKDGTISWFFDDEITS